MKEAERHSRRGNDNAALDTLIGSEATRSRLDEIEARHEPLMKLGTQPLVTADDLRYLIGVARAAEAASSTLREHNLDFSGLASQYPAVYYVGRAIQGIRAALSPDTATGAGE